MFFLFLNFNFTFFLILQFFDQQLKQKTVFNVFYMMYHLEHLEDKQIIRTLWRWCPLNVKRFTALH